MKIKKESNNVLEIEESSLIIVFISTIFILFISFLILSKPEFFNNKLHWWTVLVLLTFGLFIILKAYKLRSIIFNKLSGELVIKNKGLIKSNRVEIKIALSKIKGVIVQTVFLQNDNPKNNARVLVLVLSSGEEVLLNEIVTSLRVRGVKIPLETEIAKKIGLFLNIPVSERDWDVSLWFKLITSGRDVFSLVKK